MYQTIEMELNHKFEQDLKQAKKKSKKKIKAMFKNKIDQLEKQLNDEKRKSHQISQENEQENVRMTMLLDETFLENQAKHDQLALQNDQFSTFTTNLKNDYENIKAELEYVNEENKSKDKEIEELKAKPSLLPEDLQNFFQKITNTDLTFESGFKLELDYRHQSCKDTIKFLSLVKLPALKRFKLEALEGNDENLKKFLKNSSPPALNLFYFNPLFHQDPIGIKYYIDQLEQWMRITCDEIYLWNFKLSSKDLSTIIKSSSQCITVVIRYCEIDASEELDFSIDTNYYISNLSFHNCGRNNRSNWQKNKDQLVKILKCINNWGLKDSLDRINLYNDIGYPNTLEDAIQIAQEAQIDQDLIVHQIWKPNQG